MSFSRFFLSFAFFTIVLPPTMARQSSEVLPKIVQHAEPIYPPLARQTAIAGDVRIEFSTNGESVTDLVVESGHPLLGDAAANNIRTWKFASHTPGKFLVIFRYKFASGSTEITFPESPAIVQIEATPPMVTDIPCGIGALDIGTWKMQLSGSRVVTPLVLELSSRCAESLEGTVRGPKGKQQEIESGYYEDPFLAFAINVRQPDGRDTKAFFVGRISNHKIVGTFVDDAGRTGRWTAVQMPQAR